MDTEKTLVMALMEEIADRDVRLAAIKQELSGLQHEERVVSRSEVLGGTRKEAVRAVIATESAVLRAERKSVALERAQLQRAVEVLDRADAATLGAALQAGLEVVDQGAISPDAAITQEVSTAA
jgi:hypothetical protein